MTPLVIDASVWVSAAGRREESSDSSQAFLAIVAAARHPVVLPEFAELEIACALARRLRSSDQGRAFARRVAEFPLVKLYPVNRDILHRATVVGARRFLRAGDALYAAVAEVAGGTIVSWDRELTARAGAVTPEDWIAASDA